MTRLTLRADVGVGAIAVSPTSRDVVLAGRSGLYIADLYDPFALPRWLPLRNAWEVASVQWCPDPSRSSCVVSSSNQKVLVWNLELPSDKAVEHVLQGHRRAVTDISFSKFRQDQLATTSIDTTVCLWDLRKPQYATMRFVDFSAGGIQVKMSPTDENQLASAHNSRVVLWDRRWANDPVADWVAHIGECNGIEFMANGKLLTCSTDRTIKLWDPSSEKFNITKDDNFSSKYGNDKSVPSLRICTRDPELTVTATYPIFRALPTPYELGAAVIPLRGGDNSLRIINLARQSGTQPIEEITVSGGILPHPASIKSAVFMRTDYSVSHYDIVTWSRDAHLREWKGDALLNLPHASSASGCKDDEPPALPVDAPTYNTDIYDTIPPHNSLHDHQRGGMFDLPVFNHKKDIHHGIAHLDWISGIRVDHSEDNLTEKTADEAGTTDSVVRPSGPLSLVSGSLKAPIKLPRRRSTISSEELSQEIVVVSMRMPRVVFDKINIWAGTCEIRLLGPWGKNGEVIHIHASVEVPSEYPYEAMHFRVLDVPPEVALIASRSSTEEPESSITDGAEYVGQSSLLVSERPSDDDVFLHNKFTEINQFLYDSCSELSRHGIRSLEFCVRYLVGDPVSIEDAMASEHALIENEANIDFRELEALRPGDYNGDIPRSDMDVSSEDEDEFDVDFNELEKTGLSNTRKEEFNADGIEDNEPVDHNGNGNEEDPIGAVVQGQAPDVIDSTPIPKSCGAVWSNTGKLVCFFNQKAAPKDKGPLPLDKIFADDSQSTSSDAPFLSDSDDFEHDLPDYMIKNSNWSLGAAEVLAGQKMDSMSSPTGLGNVRIVSNGKPVTNFTAPLNHYSVYMSKSSRFTKSRTLTSQNSEDVRSSQHRKSFSGAPYDNETSHHKIVIKDFKHLWPSRPDLASEYMMNVNGSPVAMAEHNARVAQKYKLFADAHIWRLLVNYASAEEAQYSDPFASMLVDQSKFDWTGHNVGFSGLLSHIADTLEEQGNVQLLVGISTILSALRLRRAELSAEAAQERPSGMELTILEPNVEALFQLNKDGTTSFLSRRQTNSVPMTATTPGSRRGSSEAWTETHAVSQGISPTANAGDISSLQPADEKPHASHHHHQQSVVSMRSTRPHFGPVLSIEIFDKDMFDYHPQTSSVYSRGLSIASEKFSAWLARLVKYRLAYAKLLHIWGLDIERAEVLKLNLSDPLINEYQDTIKTHIVGHEQHADAEMSDRHCSLCDTLIVKTFEFCSVCSHAMHSACAQEWWQTESDCPAACGCACKDHTRPKRVASV